MSDTDAEASADEARIVPAVAGHADAAERIVREAFDGVSIDQAIERALGRGRLPWQDVKAAAVRREIETRPKDCFVAVAGDEVVGVVTTSADEAIGRGTIVNLAVRADRRGRGLGRRLIEHALGEFRRRGLIEAKIETLACNPVGQRLYPSVGFREVARQIHYAMRL